MSPITDHLMHSDKIYTIRRNIYYERLSGIMWPKKNEDLMMKPISIEGKYLIFNDEIWEEYCIPLDRVFYGIS